MTIASYKDLCMDAVDSGALGEFWSRALGAPLSRWEHGIVRLDRVAGRIGPESVWIGPVPEPRTGKTRVHLDLRLPAADPGPLLEAGATLLRAPDDEIGWWVLADPEGNAFCAFPPRPDAPQPSTTVYELVVDCADARAQAAWWSRVVGGRVEHDDDGSAAIVGAAGFPWEFWVFDPVPEAKSVKNRIHWDVQLDAPDPAGLVAAGATLLREPDDDVRWWVLADPEGNEFCAFAPR